jgi:predicted O-methyltransferase YrrM
VSEQFGYRMTSWLSGAKFLQGFIQKCNDVTLSATAWDQTMEQHLLMLLEELERFGRGHDSQETQHSHRLLNLERDTAELIRMLVLCSQRKRVLEIGTSNGYSAIYLASTLREIQGSSSLVTIERDSAKALMAKQNFERANLEGSIDLRVGSATDIVKELNGPFDCIFFDADRVSAPEQLQLLVPKLTDDVLLLADNVLSHPQEIEGYIRMFDQLPDFTTSVVRIGKGLHVAYRSGNSGNS